MTLQDAIVKDAEAYRQWALRHPWCQYCGIPEHRANFERWPGLSCHHLAKPHRSHHPANLTRACQRCHDLAECRTVRVEGVVLPWLTMGITFTVKRIREREEYNEEVLRLLLGWASLPDPLPIPDVIEAEYRANRPWDKSRFQA